MQGNNAIKFGTDGWRGVIARDYTFDNLKAVSQAVADYLGGGKSCAVGYDTRFLSAEFARACAEVLDANGIRVTLSRCPVPTPALSFAVKQGRLDLGVMITASHNPAEYNGFKIKNASGGAAGPEVTSAVEALIGKNPVRQGPPPGRITAGDLSRDYIRFIRDYIDLKKIKGRRFRLLVDAMHGSGDSFIARALEGTGIKIEFLRSEINPSFGGGRPEPVEENLGELIRRMRKEKFDLGIALDGDADRIAAVAAGGAFIHPQKILGLLALHLNQGRKWTGGIVKTICGTAMIDNIAEFLKVKLYETPVGFKYISNLMESEDIIAGGEEAGGMGVKNYIPERDGTMAGLLLLEMMAYRGKNMLRILQETERQFGRYYYLRLDLGLEKQVTLRKEDLPAQLLGRPVAQVKDYDGIKLICADKSWLMFRGSGTEPLMRVYSEAKSLARSRALLALGKKIVLGK
jgi:phosphomannomutase